MRIFLSTRPPFAPFSLGLLSVPRPSPTMLRPTADDDGDREQRPRSRDRTELHAPTQPLTHSVRGVCLRWRDFGARVEVRVQMCGTYFTFIIFRVVLRSVSRLAYARVYAPQPNLVVCTQAVRLDVCRFLCRLI